jgi:hypothetical protein
MPAWNPAYFFAWFTPFVMGFCERFDLGCVGRWAAVGWVFGLFPPFCSAFAQGDLGGMDPGAGGLLGGLVAAFQGPAHGRASPHELGDQSLSLVLGD